MAARAAIARAEHARAVHLANEAVALAREVGAKRLVGLAYVRLGDALYEAAENARARTILEQALAAIDRETMREAHVEVRWKLARAAPATGDREAALGHAMAARGTAWDIYSNATSAAARDAEGDRSGAEALHREALATVTPTGFALLRADIQGELARHRVRYGDAKAAEPLIDALVDLYRDPRGAATRRARCAARRRRRSRPSFRVVALEPVEPLLRRSLQLRLRRFSRGEEVLGTTAAGRLCLARGLVPLLGVLADGPGQHGERGVRSLPDVTQQTRGPFDVREDERHRPRRKVAPHKRSDAPPATFAPRVTFHAHFGFAVTREGVDEAGRRATAE
ncbi:MAG: hypothetical protein FJ028_06200 [Chloroflexi bacterium]|nr:hypothetical protein [Chloroflexota bacterium]